MHKTKNHQTLSCNQKSRGKYMLVSGWMNKDSANRMILHISRQVLLVCRPTLTHWTMNGPRYGQPEKFETSNMPPNHVMFAVPVYSTYVLFIGGSHSHRIKWKSQNTKRRFIIDAITAAIRTNGEFNNWKKKNVIYCEMVAHEQQQRVEKVTRQYVFELEPRTWRSTCTACEQWFQ